MKNTATKLIPTSWLASGAAIAASVLLMANQVQAQTVYRVVGPDGKITFSDKAPAAADKATVLGAGGKSGAAGGSSLPFELRQVASKYPVTLYTANNCGACSAGRTMLNSRGVPFTEKTISTAEDSEALQRMSGESSLPFMTIGSQQIKGYADSEWTQFLDAAGYPKTSVLPSSYRNPAAVPLVAVQKPAPVAKPEPAPRAPVTPSSPPVDNTSNPAGIKF